MHQLIVASCGCAHRYGGARRCLFDSSADTHGNVIEPALMNGSSAPMAGWTLESSALSRSNVAPVCALIDWLMHFPLYGKLLRFKKKSTFLIHGYTFSNYMYSNFQSKHDFRIATSMRDMAEYWNRAQFSISKDRSYINLLTQIIIIIFLFFLQKNLLV